MVLGCVFYAAGEGGLARGQDLDTVTLTGRVMDQTGALIPGATVTAILVKSGAERQAVANDDARYRLIQLEPGVYNVKASFAGFATEEKANLTTIAGQTVRASPGAGDPTAVRRAGPRAGRLPPRRRPARRNPASETGPTSRARIPRETDPGRCP